MNNWIDVDYKKPNKVNNISEIVDLWVEGERWPNCYYCFDDDNWYDMDCGITIDGATHWMSLPEPPE